MRIRTGDRVRLQNQETGEVFEGRAQIVSYNQRALGFSLDRPFVVRGRGMAIVQAIQVVRGSEAELICEDLFGNSWLIVGKGEEAQEQEDET